MPTSNPSVSLKPSPMPQHYGNCDLDKNVCVAENLEIKVVHVGNITNSNTICPSTFAGSYGNAFDLLNDGAHDQDYTGGVVVHRHPDNYKISLFGNAWKAYRLCQPYEVSQNSFLEFSFTITEEAEGHAICVEEDLNEDSFGGAHTRCVMLAGSQVDRWDAVMKYNLASKPGTSARQKSNYMFLIGDADRAIDGLIKPFWITSDEGIFNSISRTKSEANPWWEVLLDSDYEIHDVIIHNRQDAAFIDILSDFTMSFTIILMSLGQMWIHLFGRRLFRLKKLLESTILLSQSR